MQLTVRTENKSSAVAEVGDRLATMHRPKSRGCCAPFRWQAAGFLSNTMLLGPKPISVPSGIQIHPAVWPQWTWAETWGLLCYFPWGAGSPSKHNIAGDEAYLRT